MNTAVVIVNYRTPGLAIDCLKSLARDPWIRSQCLVIVVDNKSPDDSCNQIASAIRQEHWGWARLIPAERNGGFAFGNNVGIRALGQLPASERPEFVLLLNPDTIVPEGAVRTMAEFLAYHSSVGVVGSSLIDANGRIECGARRFHSPLSELDRGAKLGILSRMLRSFAISFPMQSHPHACDWVTGASMMVRMHLFEKVGLLDEGFFLYFEEVEFCRRVRAEGSEVWSLPSVLVLHLEGQATDVTNRNIRRAKYWFDSRRRYFVTGYGVAGLVVADVLWAVGALSFAVRRAIMRRPRADPQWFALDLLWGDLRAILTGDVFRLSVIDE